MSIRGLRAALREAVAAVGIPTRIVPHQFRHTYGKEMLRAGVSFAAVMKLLRHKSPHMTLDTSKSPNGSARRRENCRRTRPRGEVKRGWPQRATSRDLQQLFRIPVSELLEIHRSKSYLFEKPAPRFVRGVRIVH